MAVPVLRRAEIKEVIHSGKEGWAVVWDDETLDVLFESEMAARDWYKAKRRIEREAYSAWLRENVTEWDEFGQGYRDGKLIACICGALSEDGDWSGHYCPYDDGPHGDEDEEDRLEL